MPGPLVSCICLSENRVNLLKTAVFDFMNQTYPNKELIIITSEDDLDTINANFQENEFIKLYSVSSQTSIGNRRNLAIDVSDGDIIAIWDDDDHHAPDRIRIQLKYFRNSNIYKGSILMQIKIVNTLTGESFNSKIKMWEGTLVCKKKYAPKYLDKNDKEDSLPVRALNDKGYLAVIYGPQYRSLYHYNYHGGNINTWDTFKKMIPIYSV